MTNSKTSNTSLGVVLVLLLLLSACGTDVGSPHYVELTVANHASVSDLATASEYLVMGVVIDSATKTAIGEDLGLVYMVSEVEIQEVLAERPDVSVHLAHRESIRIGIGLLDTDQSSNIANFGKLSEEFPTTEQALTKDDHVLLFLVSSDYLEAPGPDYAAVGYGVIDKDGQIAWKGFPGDLAGTKADLATVRADAIARYGEPAPWRQVSEEPVPGLDLGPEGRPPLAEPE